VSLLRFIELCIVHINCALGVRIKFYQQLRDLCCIRLSSDCDSISLLVLCGIIGIAVGLIGIVYSELTAADIAQFTPEQRYTYDVIGQHMMLLDGPNNNSTLTNKEIQAQIMEYFIVNGHSYCGIWKDNQYGGYCTDTSDKSWYNNLVKKEYMEIIKRNQPGLLNELTKFFGF